jgi:hypothetical protein
MASIPENFNQTILDFIVDIETTFPEHTHILEKWKNMTSDVQQTLYEYISKVYPERFFDILYQNTEIFQNDEINTKFLPELDFKVLYNDETVSDNTRQVLWKYLQLILFLVVGNIKDKSMFGESANIFDGIEEDELGNKLKETMDDLGGFFKNMGLNMDQTQEEEKQSTPECDASSGLPNIENLQDHLKSLFDGKIGKLAKDLAEEISTDFSSVLGDFGEIDENNPPSTNDILKKLMKNPKKIMDLVKTVGSKIKSKMDDGEINKEDLMGEASEILSKMKEMGGTDEMNEILKKFAGSMGKNMKIDKNALNRMSKTEAMKERMRQKLEKKQQEYNITEEEGKKKFSLVDEDKQERSTKTQAQIDEELIASFVDPQVVTKKSKKSKKKK